MKISRNIRKVSAAFCMALRERYIEKLIEDNIRSRGGLEQGEMPNIDKNVVEKFDNNLIIFEAELEKLIAKEIEEHNIFFASSTYVEDEIQNLAFVILGEELNVLVPGGKLTIGCTADSADVYWDFIKDGSLFHQCVYTFREQEQQL